MKSYLKYKKKQKKNDELFIKSFTDKISKNKKKQNSRAAKFTTYHISFAWDKIAKFQAYQFDIG